MNKTWLGLGVMLLLVAPTACGSDDGDSGGTGGSSTGGSSTGGSSTGGSSTGGSSTGGSSTGGSSTGGSAGAGGSSGAGGTSAGGTSAGGSGGTSAVDCKALEVDYAKALAKAKTCSLAGPTPAKQCGLQVDNKLACACPTYADPGNTAAVKELAILKSSWLQNKCDVGVNCPKILCPQPTGGKCSASSGSLSGSCVDVP